MTDPEPSTRKVMEVSVFIIMKCDGEERGEVVLAVVGLVQDSISGVIVLLLLLVLVWW